MSATVFSAAQFGLADDSTATGLLAASVGFSATSSMAQAPDHIGNTAGFAVYERKKDITVSGVIKTKGTGLVGSIGTLITLANTTTNTRTRLSESLGVTPVANSGIVVTASDITPTNSDFEGGSLTGVFFPGVAVNSPVTLT
jgi:hypothetical protein